MANPVQKILVLGNAASGKTLLSRRLAKLHKIKVTHVDSLQFLPGLVLRPHQETLQMILAITQQPSWILDGFGPLDDLQERISLADRVILIDWPIWRNYFWLAKRQLQSLWRQRPELPTGSNEWNLQHTLKVISNIWKVHKLMRPELLRILSHPNHQTKVIYVRDKKSYEEVCQVLFLDAAGQAPRPASRNRTWHLSSKRDL